MRARSATESSFELHATFLPGTDAESGWKLLGADGTYTTVGYDPRRPELFVDRTHSGNTAFHAQFPARTAAPLPVGGRSLELAILVDRSTLTLTNLIYPPKGTITPEFFGGGRVAVELWDIWSGWPASP